MPEKIIHITVRDKVVSVDKDAKIVCCNTDYKAVFDFDSEWDSYDAKTAYFAVNGKLIPVVFRGVECDIPYIENTTLVGVGVGSSDISEVDSHEVVTTLPAYLPALLSIKDVGGGIEAPTIDEWNQVIGLINAGMVRGEKGDKGDKGDMGAIKFIPTNVFPAENIDDSAIYLIPTEEGEDNRYAEYAYINGTWEKIGETTLKIDTSELVKKTDYANATTPGVVLGDKTYGFTVTANGIPAADIIRANEYADKTVACFIGKGTLENVKHNYVKQGITTNTETLTDDEKASACAWLGALPKIEPTLNDGSGVERFWVNNGISGSWRYVQGSRYTASPWYIASYMSEYDGDYAGSGYLLTNTPKLPYQSANKNYIDNLPEILVLTDTQQKTWCDWMGAVSKETASEFYVPAMSPSNTPKVYAVNEIGQTQYPIAIADVLGQEGAIPLYRPISTSGFTDPQATLVVATPKNDYHSANKKYVDEEIAKAIIGGEPNPEPEGIKEVIFADIDKMLREDNADGFEENTQKFSNGESVIVVKVGGKVAVVNSVDVIEDRYIDWVAVAYGESDATNTPIFKGIRIRYDSTTKRIQTPEFKEVALDFATKDFVKSLPTKLALSVDEKLQWREMIGAINQAYVDTELAKKADNLKLLEVVASSHIVNITQMSTIYDSYDSIKGVTPKEGNGARYLVRTNGSTPLYYYTYNATTGSWEKGYEIKGSTLYVNLEDACLYRYTNSTTTKPYKNFVQVTISPDTIRGEINTAKADLSDAITAVDEKIPTKTETWTFTLENGTTVTKEIFVK